MRHLLPKSKKADSTAAQPNRMARALRKHPKPAKSGVKSFLPDALAADEGVGGDEADVFLPWLVNATILLQGELSRTASRNLGPRDVHTDSRSFCR